MYPATPSNLPSASRPIPSATTDNTPYEVSANGYFGEFGGAFIPEMLRHNFAELAAQYRVILESANFQAELSALARDFVGRPSPLYLAKRLSAELGATIYLKREDVNHTGSHKINNALGQVLLARRLGKTRIIAETGAGQHGVATATVCAHFGMPCVVHMGEKDMARQALNVEIMRMLGAEVRPAVSGSRTLKDAVNEAFRDWVNNPECHYLIGSVVGAHPFPDLVMQLQRVIGREARAQLAALHTTADYVVACIGGGSNAAGMFYNFLPDSKTRLVAVEADGLGAATGKTAAAITAGTKGVLHGAMTYLMQDADGQVVEPYSLSAGLDYPGVGPVHAHLASIGRVEMLSVTDSEAVAAAMQLMQLEGIIPALESAHALAGLAKLALNPDDVVALCLSGRGDKDLATYQTHRQEQSEEEKENAKEHGHG